MSAAQADFVTGVQALAKALGDACTDPADAVRLLDDLSQFFPDASYPASVIGQSMGVMQEAVGDICRRSAVIALARVSTKYQPASYDDAVRLRRLVCTALDVEITVAADQGEDKTYRALRALRAAVVQDFEARGANLSRIAEFKTQASMPSLALANRFYGDTQRTDELVTHADPRHPLFMPTEFKALAE